MATIKKKPQNKSYTHKPPEKLLVLEALQKYKRGRKDKKNRITLEQMEDLFMSLDLKYHQSLEETIVQNSWYMAHQQKTIEELTKKGTCEHTQIGYNELSKISWGMFARSKQDQKNIKKALDVIKWQKKHIVDLEKINVAMVDKYENALEAQEKQIQDCHKDKNDITRAYNGLHSMGKFAEEEGIDIKKACRDLPENKHKYTFKDKHTLLESGKVSHTYFQKKKNGKADE